MGSAKVSGAELFRPDGTYMKFLDSGVITGKWSLCDKCLKPKPMLELQDIADLMWLCKDCR
jgi:hypothetical protein